MAESKDKKIETKSPQALREEEVLKFWQENKIFEKTEGRGDNDFVFYDGPPFASGLPHYGHILAGTIKDAIPRYQVMQGKKLRRRWGWDCHGLPVENLIEKELGLNTKKDIETYSIEKFNEAAGVHIMKDVDSWEKIVPRLGRFVDMKDDYKTMDSTYTESVWWAFKTLHDKNLIYKGFKSMQLCPRCETTLSNFEVNQGYKDITDISVYVKFELADEPNTFLIAWTTTPWTLPGNFALAVNSEIEYVKVKIKDSGGMYIVAKERLGAINEEMQIEKTFKGSELVGKTYQPVFDYYAKEEFENKGNAWKVYAGDFVSTEDGTGIVHIAPAFGEDDLNLALKNNIPIIHHVTESGQFKKEVKDFAGLFVKPKDNKEEKIDHTDSDVQIIKYLAREGVLFAKEKIIHSYPHCWRCDTPLLNYAHDSWFVRVTDFKDKLVAENKKIKWIPESIGQYRFGNWLEGARDWAISRARFWGAPLPVWVSEDGTESLVAGSLDDLKKHIKNSGNKYFVMRHGEAEFNVKGILNGRPNKNNKLTEVGLKSIGVSAEKIKDSKIDFIFTSPLERTIETSTAIAKIIGISEEQIKEDERIIELQFGTFEEKSFDEYHAFYKEGLDKFSSFPEGGETFFDLQRRASSFLYDLEKNYKDKNILIVTHGDPAMIMQSFIKGLSPKESLSFINSASYIQTGEIIELPFVPLPHNEKFELDFHRPYIDEVQVEKNGKPLKRVREVFDCWFESGSMPYAQDHYPFNKEFFDPEINKGFPADFIAEGVDQTRGWFYSMLVLGTALFGESPYKHVIVNGLVLAEDGQKMSKRLKNYPDPMDVVSKYGADALRYYLLSSPIMRGEDLNFSEKGVAEVANKIIGRLLNVCSFYELYSIDLYDASYKSIIEGALSSENILDQWIHSRLGGVIKETTENLESYELDKACRPIGIFIDDLSTWYLRRSRDRFKSDSEKDRRWAQSTLHFVLIELSKVIAPTMPFTAEYIYQKLKLKDGKESVHLENWPRISSNSSLELNDKMKVVRDVVTLGLEARAKANIKVRQPLGELRVKNYELRDKEEYLSLIKDEVNVKEIIFDEKLEGEVELDLSITEELKAEGDAREVIRAIQEARKEANLIPADFINVSIEAEKYVADAILKWQEEIKKVTNTSTLTVGSGELDGDNAKFKISIEKV